MLSNGPFDMMEKKIKINKIMKNNELIWTMIEYKYDNKLKFK
jgi:hypothetical protein